jgi:hypothetical protein
MDAISYPTKSVKPPAKINTDIFIQNFETFSSRELAEARALLDEESKLFSEGMIFVIFAFS